MTFQTFRSYFQPFVAISLSEIRKWDPNFDLRRILEWQKKGYLARIVRGWYRLNEQPLTTESLFTIANAIYAPSYISLESALAYYHLIPEGVHQLTSISTKKTTTFSTAIGHFTYHSIIESAFFGYTLVQSTNQTFKIATLEKTLLDYCYFHDELDSADAIASLRLNRELLFEALDRNRLQNDLTRMDSRTLSQRVQKVLEYA